MLDCHVIVRLDAQQREWLTQCLKSVHEAANRAGFPVSVHLTPYVEGNIGKARSSGYAMGDQPYVAYVDDDDYILPFAFQQMREALESGVSAVCAPEQTWQNGHIRLGLKRHHLIAYRRDTLIDHTQWPCCGDLAQINAIGPDAIDLPIPAYVHRLYTTSKARVLRRSHPDELVRARG